MTTIKVAKTEDGKVVEIVRTADMVGFSKERGWVLVCSEIGKMSSLAVKWVPASTRFVWVRDFHFQFAR
jgi:hypothetical protein